MAASFLEVRDVFLRKKRYVPFFCIGLSGVNGRDGVDGLWVKGNGDNVDSAVFCMFCTLFYRLNEDFGEFVC